jgi:rhodanese-related sulfurtransferase
MKLQRSYLIQRLNAPYGGINPFSFGGGKVNGGLSKEAAVRLSDIFAFDYMGAAEYEWGEVPEAIEVLGQAAKDGELVRHVVGIDMPNATNKGATIQEHQEAEPVTVHVICRKGHEDEIAKRVLVWARTPHFDRPTELRPRDWEMLDRAVQDPENARTMGWLVLNDPFFFCLPEVMADNFFGYLNQEVPADPKGV